MIQAQNPLKPTPIIITNEEQETSLLSIKNNPFLQSAVHWWHKVALFLLIAQGLQGTWQSVKFIAIDYREFENKLSLHQIDTAEINFLIATALIALGAALINIFMAIRLSKVKKTTAHNIDLFIATIIILGTNYVQKFLVQLDLFNLITNLF